MLARVIGLLCRLLVTAGFFLITACGGGSGSTTEKPTGNDGKSSNAQSSKAAVKTLLTWTPPNSREDGQYLELDEIGGYEIRYKLAGGDYIYVPISALIKQFSTVSIPKGAQFEIAVYDTHGVYSEFVPIQPH